jgi:hypothetical protein
MAKEVTGLDKGLAAHIANASPEVQTQVAVALSRLRGLPDHEVQAHLEKTLGIEHSKEQLKELALQPERQKAVESAVALTAQAQQLAAQGRSETQISGELAGKGASTSVAQNFAQKGVQQQKQDERQQVVADSDAAYRIEKGIAQPQSEIAMAAALANHAGVAAGFTAALGGHAQNPTETGTQQTVAKVAVLATDAGRGRQS